MATTMRRSVIALALLCAACDFQLPGLTGLDSQLEEARVVASVHCGADTLAVGQSTACIALNPAGATITWGSSPAVAWGTSDPTVAQVTLDGQVRADRVGTVAITARGARGSEASDTVTVQ